MFVAFIDFKNAYDRVNQNKLWDCLVGIGFEGTLVEVFRAVYMELKREVIMKVGEMASESILWCGEWSQTRVCSVTSAVLVAHQLTARQTWRGRG